MGQSLDNNLTGVVDYPYTISFSIRKSLQVDSFLELPKDKRPPESIWDNSSELEKWMDNWSSGEPNSTELTINDWEIE